MNKQIDLYVYEQCGKPENKSLRKDSSDIWTKIKDYLEKGYEINIIFSCYRRPWHRIHRG